MLKLIIGLFLLLAVLSAGSLAIYHFYPEKVPARFKVMIEKAKTQGLDKAEEVIPLIISEEEKRAKAIIAENKRIAAEESIKLKRLTEEKLEYEFNKAFNMWYELPEECKKARGPQMISECANKKRDAMDRFKLIWESRNNQ